MTRVYIYDHTCVNVSEKTVLPAPRGTAINEEPVKTQCAGVGQVGGLREGGGSGSQGPPSLEEALVGNPDLEVSGRRGLRRGQESGPGVCRA